MENQFSLTDDHLKVLINSFSDWGDKNKDEKKYPVDHREKGKKLKETLLNIEYLNKVSDEELVQNVFDYSRTLEGPAYIRLGMPRISGQISELRRNLKYLIETQDDPFKKAKEILEGEYKIPIFAKAFWTPLFQAQFPDKLPNWNNKTENFFKKLGIDLKTRKINVEEKYRRLSDAFLYLKKLDPKQDFYNLNHLMHYGTVIKEGSNLIESMLPTQQKEGEKPGNNLEKKIAKWRNKHVPEERINVRRKAESIARNLLSEKAGKLDESLLRKFFQLINEDFWNDKIIHTRFGLAYTGHNINQILTQIDKVNEWIVRLWSAQESELKQILNDYYSQKPIKNAGRAFPSLILYIRDPDKFNNCFYKMVKGLKSLINFSEDGYSGDFYFEYNDKVNQLKKEYGLIPEELDILLCLDESEFNDIDTHKECPFSKKTFELLQGLHNQPDREFYNQYKEDFKNDLEHPFKELFKNVAEHFSPLMKEHLELNKGLFSRITKNDYGKGGAWSHYWGAFYPKGGKRIEDAQLSIWMNKDFFQFGFYIGAYGVEQKKRFLLNCRNNQSALEEMLAEPLSNPRFIYGDWDKKLTDGDIPEDVKEITWKKWLAAPDDKGINVGIYMTRNEILSLPKEKLIDEIVFTFNRLFPLIILTFSENPIPLITEFLGLDQNDHEINPVYPLEQCAHDVGFDTKILDRWVRAIERKKQAVIYGPPGTGKTFIAEHLAKHLIGGGDGFSQIVQFHPAYAYEDFIQGIRPKPIDGGGLHYPVVPGLFLKFCEKAKSFQDRCVLIIDEINRANLARVFGELMYLLEYRTQEVPLASGGYLRIPDNVRIIGTMNTADRSIALVDHALRRRFAFLSLYPNYEVLSRYHKENNFDAEPLINLLKRLNKQIADRHYEVGISFFLREDLTEHIADIWEMEIEPYLEEYFFDQPEKVDSFRWDKIGKDIVA